VVPSEPQLAALIDRPAERSTIQGAEAQGEAATLLDFEMHRNEVMLWVRTQTGRRWDIAVGFDDFQDVLGQASDVACRDTN
jgi:hypothetical protein